MPKGKRRHTPPPGYTTATVAIQRLGKMLYKHVKAGLIHKVSIPGSTQGFYLIEDIEAVEKAERVFSESQKTPDMDAYFTPATPGDMDALYAMAVKLFPKTADATRRRSWMSVEPRGCYIMKDKAGAVVAYFYILPLLPDRLAAYLHGELPSRAIAREDLEPFVPGRPASACVLGGIGSDPDVAHELRTGYTAMLLRGVRYSLAQLGQEGIIIPKFYAFSETTEGIAMCAKLGMQQWEPPQNKRCTFFLDTETSPVFFLREYKRALQEYKRSQAPQPPVASTTPNIPLHSEKASKTRSERASAPIERPEGTITLQELAKQVGRSDKTLLGHLQKWDKAPASYPQFEHIKIAIANRPGLYSRYFTAEQVASITTWIEAYTKKAQPSLFD